MPVYVDSAASGANDGTSWTDAYTAIASTLSVAAGTQILIDDGHSEDLGSGSVTLDWTNGTMDSPVEIYSVDKADDSYSPGAYIYNGGSSNIDLKFEGNIRVFGLTGKCRRFLYMNSANAKTFQRYEDCTFGWAGGTGSKAFQIGRNSKPSELTHYISCHFDCSGASISRNFICQNAEFVFENCTFTEYAGTPSSELFTIGGVDCSLTLRGCDLSDLELSTKGFLVWQATEANFKVLVQACKLPSAVLWIDGTPGSGQFRQSMLLVEGCTDGTISVPELGLTYKETQQGVVQSDLSRYRTGGADDGYQANAHSWEMVSSSMVGETTLRLEAPELRRWVDAGSQTITLYFAGGATLQDDEFGIDVCSPSEAGSPTTRCAVVSTRMTPLGTPANLDADGSSTWNGSGVGTVQKIDVAIAPTVAGWVTVRPWLAKPSTTVYIDPRIAVA